MSVEAERLRRLRECWQSDQPSALEVANAERRFRTRRGVRQTAFFSWGLVGASAGVVAMLALSPIARSTNEAPAHGSITAEPPGPPPAIAPAASPDWTTPSPPPTEVVPTKPARAKNSARPRVGSALPTETDEPTRKSVRDETSLRGAPRWLSVGPGSEPVITGLEHEKKPASPGN